jgi:transposase-like protein
MTTDDIQAHLAAIYDAETSRETISKITDVGDARKLRDVAGVVSSQRCNTV